MGSNTTNHIPQTSLIMDRATEIAGYTTLVIGYLMCVLTARQLTLANFLAFTVLQILYGLAFWWLAVRRTSSGWQMFLALVLLSLFTFASGMLAGFGIGFDWLLYFVTAAMYFYFLSFRAALPSAILLYLASGINTGFLNSWHLTSDWFTLLAGFGFVAAFSLSNKQIILQRRRAEQLLSELEQSNQALETAHTQLQDYANEIEELAVVRERTRLAREIHDTLGHYLTILSIQLETISKLQERNPAQAMNEVTEARRVAAQSMQEVRNAVAALRPTSIATLNLKDALRQLANEFCIVAPHTALTLDLEETQLPLLTADIQHALYRAAQEALTNVRKHAHATKVLLRLRFEDEHIELVILDNGIGQPEHDLTKHTGGFGLLGLQERIELLGGRVTHGPADHTGYRITICVPVSNAQKYEKTKV